jgi:hypothetical protein
MTLISEAELKDWLSQHNLSWDDEHGYIKFSGGVDENRFWKLPEPARRIVYFLTVILDSIDPWEELVICKQGASGWYSADDTTGVLDAVHDQIIASTNLPRNFKGAIRAGHTDYTSILTLVFDQLLFGWCVWDDVYLIPDHTNQIIQTSHHDVVHVEFRDPSEIDSFVAAMAAGEFLLPNEVPDGTFKVPHWMRSKSA